MHFLSRIRRPLAPLGHVATSAPSRSPRRAWGAAVACALAAVGLAASPAQAQFTERNTWQGPYGYVVSGTSLRTQPNNGSGSNPACQLTSNPTSITQGGVPAGATLVAAYLYWAGSGSTVDQSISFNGTTVSPEFSETEPYNNGGTILNFSGGGRDVTSLVAATGTGNGNGTFTVSNFTASVGSPWCSVQAVMASWSLVVVYREPGATPKRVQLRDGMVAIREGSHNIALSGFVGAATPAVRFSYVVHEGDPDQSGTTGDPERVRWITTTNTYTLENGNPFNSTVNGATNIHGLDIESHNTTLPAGGTSATLELSSGPDLVLAQTVVTSIAIAPVYGVTVTPDGLAQPVQRLPGTGYAQPFTITNTGNLDDTYNLILSGTGNPLFAVLDSVRGPGLVTTVRPDSARLTVPSGQSIVVNLWYSVPVGPTADNTGYLRARSVPRPATLDDGFAQVRRVSPQLTITKSVSPQNTLAPGTDLTYTMQIANAGNFAARGVVVSDSVPPQVVFKLGSVGQTVPAGITAAPSYSNNAGATWTYVPVSGGCGAPAGYDACVRRVRWTLTGDVAVSGTASFFFVARIR